MTIYENYKLYCTGILASGDTLLLGKKCKHEYLIMAIKANEKDKVLHFEKRYYTYYALEPSAYIGDSNIDVCIWCRPRKVKTTEKEWPGFHITTIYGNGTSDIDIFISDKGYVPITLKASLEYPVIYFPVPIKMLPKVRRIEL